MSLRWHSSFADAVPVRNFVHVRRLIKLGCHVMGPAPTGLPSSSRRMLYQSLAMTKSYLSSDESR